MNTKHGYTCIYRLNTMTQSEEAKKQKNFLQRIKEVYEQMTKI